MSAYYPKHAGKTVLVTGGTQGIGLGIVRRFLNEGANVVAADLTAADFLAGVSDIAAEGQARFIQMDVTNFGSVEAGIAETLDTYGALDTLICNAGTAKFGDLETISFEDWQLVLDIIVNGTFHCVRAALPALRESKGAVVSTSSISGLGANRGLNAYFPAKAAQINLTRYMALEYGKDGIRFNTVAPGPIDSHPEMTTPFSDPEVVAHYAETTPLGRIGTTDDLAGIFSFLASEDSKWITGQTLVADGGLTLWTGEYDLGKAIAKMTAGQQQ